MLKHYIPFRTSAYWYGKINGIVEKESVPLSWLVRYLVEIGLKNMKLAELRQRAREDGVL